MDLSTGLENTVAALISEHEAERERVGRLLHDEIGQILSGAGLQMTVLRMDFQEVPGIVEKMAELQEMLELAMVRVRDLSNELNPSEVERSGLHFALEGLLNRHRMLFSGGSRLHFESPARLPREVAKAFYRVAEYTVARAARRVDATQADVRVKTDASGVTMEIQHDGHTPGLEAGADPADRIELLALEHHARRAGVTFRVESAPGRGTIVTTGYLHVAEERKND